MSVKLLFDENTGAPFVGVFRQVVALDRKRSSEIGHTIELFGKGAKDHVWIPKLVGDGWVLISEDRGRNSKLGDRLPSLCRQHSIKHILVLPSLLRNGGQVEKMRALMAVWPALWNFSRDTSAGGFAKLKYSGSSKTSFKLELVEV